MPSYFVHIKSKCLKVAAFVFNLLGDGNNEEDEDEDVEFEDGGEGRKKNKFF